jgi:hypothetical protein
MAIGYYRFASEYYRFASEAAINCFLFCSIRAIFHEG